MLKMLKVIGLIITAVISTSSYANNSYVIDFGTDTKYVASLNNLRRDLGPPLGNINVSGTRVYELPPQSSEPMDGLLLQIRGVDFYEDEGEPDLQFVMNPRNLYVAGFITGNIFYRFHDMQDTTAPGNPRVVTLQDNSDYITLQGVARLNRNNMQINRSNLMDGYRRLTQFTEHNVSLDESSARALLRYLTIIPEAIRFRQIQRGFRPALAPAASNYIVSGDDVTITNNWSRLSAALPNVDTLAAPGVRIGAISLPDATAIVTMLAVALHCSKSTSKHSFIMSDSFDTCSDNGSVVINKIVWDTATFASAFDI
jgi:shiga toxin subunit A